MTNLVESVVLHDPVPDACTGNFQLSGIRKVRAGRIREERAEREVLIPWHLRAMPR
jgi:hypothetical protein